MINKFYKLRCGIIVKHIRDTSNGKMVIQIVEAAHGKPGHVGQERIINEDGSGYIWGECFDIIGEVERKGV